MKRFIFTLMAFVALVLVANTTFAQSTPQYPFTGATEDYTVSGLTVGDSVFFFVTNNDTTFWDNDNTAAALTSGAGVFTFGTTTGLNASNKLTGTSVTQEITWQASADTFYVWIGIKSPDGCFNFRFAPVEFRWDVQIFAAAISDTTTNFADLVDLTEDSLAYLWHDTIAVCAVIEQNSVNYNDTIVPGDLSGGVTKDGSTWIYYRIVRRNAADIANSWTYTLSLVGNAVSIQYSEDGTTWTPSAEGAKTVTSDINVVYVRAEYHAGTSDQNVIARVDSETPNGANPSEATSGLTDKIDATDQVYVTISAKPSMGTGFGF